MRPKVADHNGAVTTPEDCTDCGCSRSTHGVRGALALARDTWLDAFGTTPSDAAAPRPELWRMTAAVMADRNAHEAVHYAADIATAWGTVRPGGPA